LSGRHILQEHEVAIYDLKGRASLRPVFTGTWIHLATIALIRDSQLSWRVHFKISFDKIDFDDIGYLALCFSSE